MCILDERISACTSPGDGHTGNPPRRIFYFIFSLLSDYVDSSREENIISVAKRAHASSEKKKRTHRGQRNELNKKRKKRKKKTHGRAVFFFFVNFLLISSFSAFVNPRERKKKKMKSLSSYAPDISRPNLRNADVSNFFFSQFLPSALSA